MEHFNYEPLIPDEQSPQSSKKSYIISIFVIIFLFVVLIAGIVVFFLVSSKQSAVSPQDEQLDPSSRSEAVGVDYVIPGVPAVHIYSEVLSNTPIRTIDAAVLYMVLKYWGLTDEEINIEKLASEFPPSKSSVSNEEILNYIKKLGYEYDVKVEKISTIQDLKKYINSNTRTPLIFSSARDIKNLSNRVRRVLIGILETKKKVVVHDFHRGNNYEIPFDEFKILQEGASPDYESAYLYLVIQPPKKDGVILNDQPIEQKPPERTALMESDALAEIFTDIGIGLETSDPQTKASLIKNAVDHPQYSELMAKHWQVYHWSQLARALIELEEYDSAKEAIDAAFSLNHDLDKPEPGWPSYPTKELHSPWAALKEYYTALAFIETDPIKKAALNQKAEEALQKDIELRHLP